MGVRYTNGPIVYQTSIRTDTPAHTVADLDSVMSQVAEARAAVTGGFKYTLQSPDGLQMKVWIQNLGDNDGFHNFTRITPTSANELLTGQLAFLVNGEGGFFEAWADIAQLFIGPYGSPGTSSAVSFACGVPALPPNASGPCTVGVTVPTVTDLWWTSSSGNGSGGGAVNFRQSRYALGSYTLTRNGVMYLASGNTDPNSLWLAPICSTINVDLSTGTPPNAIKYGSGEPMRVDALLGQQGLVVGQLWDAFLRSAIETIDSEFDYTDTDSDGNPLLTSWIAWNNTNPGVPSGGAGTMLATLYLLKQPQFTTSLANISY